MKKITLLLLLVYNPVFSEDNSTCDYVEDYPEQTSDKELEKSPVDVFRVQWENKLNKYLLSQDDPYLNFMALLMADSSLRFKDDSANTWDLKIKNQINNFLLDDQLTPESIDLMLVFCQNYDEKSICDIDEVINKRIDMSPENMLVYIEPLEKALDDGNYELSRLILSTMALKTQINSHYYLKSSLNDAIQIFAEENPIPEFVS
ncbi:MAG: hypothetical protein L3J52_07145, partial [Proteobacteria bacterium]|nr:hypothetical protein [Pseudomonadota bacterium]